MERQQEPPRPVAAAAAGGAAGAEARAGSSPAAPPHAAAAAATDAASVDALPQLRPVLTSAAHHQHVLGEPFLASDSPQARTPISPSGFLGRFAFGLAGGCGAGANTPASDGCAAKGVACALCTRCTDALHCPDTAHFHGCLPACLPTRTHIGWGAQQRLPQPRHHVAHEAAPPAGRHWQPSVQRVGGERRVVRRQQPHRGVPAVQPQQRPRRWAAAGSGGGRGTRQGQGSAAAERRQAARPRRRPAGGWHASTALTTICAVIRVLPRCPALHQLPMPPVA